MTLSIRQILSQNHFAFAKLLGYRIQLVLAYQMMMVAVGWHIYELTHDPFALGLIGLAEVIPYFGSALFAGHAVDHYYTRRGFAMLSALFLAINAFALAAVAYGWLPNMLVFIYVAIALTGFARALISPSFNTLFALVVPRESIPKAAGIGGAAFQIGLIVGPAMGGLLIGFADTKVAYILATLLSLGSAISAYTIRVQETRSQDKTSVFTSIGQGLRFVWGNQVVLSAQMLDMFAVLFGGAVAMLPAFVHDVYHMGPEGLGMLRAAPAVGAILTGVWLAKHPLQHHMGRWLLFAVAGFGMCMVAFGMSQNFWFSVFILSLSGVMDGVSVVLRQTIVQLATPDAMRGRVSAINGIFIGSSNELGAFESGVAARLMGLVPSVIFGGLMTIGVVGVVTAKAPKLRNLHLHQLK